MDRVTQYPRQTSKRVFTFLMQRRLIMPPAHGQVITFSAPALLAWGSRPGQAGPHTARTAGTTYPRLRIFLGTKAADSRTMEHSRSSQLLTQSIGRTVHSTSMKRLRTVLQWHQMSLEHPLQVLRPLRPPVHPAPHPARSLVGSSGLLLWSA